MIEDCQRFLKFIKDLETYLIEFKKNKLIKTKII